MNIFHEFRGRIVAAIERLQCDGIVPATVRLEELGLTAEPPRDPTHGDVSTNAAMVLAKPSGMAPRALAEKLAPLLADADDVARTEIAGPGFINIALAPSWWPRILRVILEQRENFGRSEIGRGAPVNVEYVSANPTGPLHIGHCRGAVFGDALANLLSFSGYAVTREYYVNDAGAQVDTLARSAFLRYREALGEDVGQIGEGLYPGDYLVPVGKVLAELHGDSLRPLPETEWLTIVRAFAIDAMMALIRDDLAALGIHQDVFFSERSLTRGPGDRVAATIDDLKARGLVYEGRLPPPKGKPAEDWEDRDQILFRATAFGDDVDRPLVKSDGSYTYFSGDMAYHADKLSRGFETLIDVWGADHGGYVKRVQAAVNALSEGKADLDVKLCQLVRLYRAGEPVRMSKRSGDFVTLREVVDEVGPDVVRFMMLTRKNDAPLDFDFVKATEQSRDNPVFYVQYAHARTCSVFRQAQEIFPDLTPQNPALASAELDRLQDPAELSLIQRLAHYPRILEAAAASHEPHRIAFYLYDLASELHSLWNRGKELPQLRFIHEGNRKLTEARMALVAATQEVLRSGLTLLGVCPVTEMR